MRSEGNKKKKKPGKLTTAELAVIVTGILVATILVGFFLWVIYGDEKDKGRIERNVVPQQEQEKTTAVLNVAEDWSVPETCFKGGNGVGKFDGKDVKMVIDKDKLFQEMGVDEASGDEGDKTRIDAVNRFLEGLEYQAEPAENLSNGDEITVTIASKEEVSEIEQEAEITIEGVGKTKQVTVSGLADKYSYGELAGQTEILQAARETAEQKIRESAAGNLQEIFAEPELYNAELTYYGTYLAKPQDNGYDDALIVLYRMTSTYPDDNYSRWTQDGDYVYTYEMTHFDGIDKETTADEIKDGLKYDSFRYENQSVEVLDFYRKNLDPGTTYVIQQVG